MLGFALGEHHDADLAYGALVMAVAVRGGAVPGVIMHTDQGSEYTAGRVPGGLRAAGHLPVDGPARVGAGQRGHRIVALDPGVRAAAHRALRDQGGGPGRGRGLDRGLQPPPPALLAGPDLPGGLRAVAGGKGRRVTAGRPLRGPGPEGGGFAAAHLQERAAALRPGDAPRKGTGPPLSVKAGCDRGTTANRHAAWHMYTRSPALSAEPPAAPEGRKSGQAQPAPARSAARPVTTGPRRTSERQRTK